MNWKSLLWKVYFFFMCLIFLLHYVIPFLKLSYLRYIDLLFTSIAFIAFFGYIFRKQIFTQRFWKIYFFVYLIFEFLNNFIIVPYIEQREFSLLFFIVLLVFLPFYITLYLYSFKFMDG